ncbi:amino acid ABC transporter membrane protein, paat family [Halosimplex carlsbadense 2-9-1]|uniref:Amino acid ABC transporter membrane protein, paat family n=1 Tax=Halosimplex carlsbadense 2-9-1 TaxID=797114 RepID=M0CYP6_9EURY|nr:amino acid ABC transporter permease [Halosimplex carlsbadense]ELZ27532.1 amino acid ABC transporter membrane protein, paat family [Halosimplex carlsbadense 2-9-1]
MSNIDTDSETQVSQNRSGNILLVDERLRWIGLVLSLMFTGLVAYIMYRIVLFVDPELLVTIFPRFLEAFWLVLRIVLVSSALSIILGTFVGLARISTQPITHYLATGYVEFFRGTPLLFQLIVLYVGIPALWEAGQFPYGDNWQIIAAVVGLTLNHAAYVGEAVKGGINAIPNGQMEAARSLGLSYTQSMWNVILPQGFRNALAALGNDQVILIKDTSLLTVIAVPELITVYRNVNTNQFDPWTPILFVCLGYLSLTIPLGMLVRKLERMSQWGNTDG